MTLRASALIALAISFTAFAQNGRPSKEEIEKQLYEYVEKEVSKYESQLALEDWQIFYADSILTYNLKSMQAEYDKYVEAKIANSDLYTKVADKWNEKTYDAMKAILNDKQWAKYLKLGAGKEKKARDKRKEKEGK
ncbi:MAG: hypothetical protein K5984_00455 [Bacteroidales bacterium]|nr:hypothetical protein [Bacteroidales bacterium]